YHGALRNRILPASKAAGIGAAPRQPGEALFILEVTPEPRLQNFVVTASPRLEKAVDEQGQELALAMEPALDPNATVQYQPGSNPYNNRVLQRQVALRLKLGDKQAKELTELKGSLAVQALSVLPEALITVPEVAKAAGKKAD